MHFPSLLEEMACSWATALAEGRPPASWAIYDRLRSRGTVGILVPSFAPGAEEDDRTLCYGSGDRTSRIG